MESNYDLKENILNKTKDVKNNYTNILETLEDQNELIENNYNKIVDVNERLKESSSIIKKIKKGICDCFKTKPREKKDNINKIIITNKSSKQKNLNFGISPFIEKKKNNELIENNNFKNKLLNELDDIHNLSKIQNEQIINQNKILNKMENNTEIVNNKIKKNNKEIKDI
jgi:hypothetical protein